MLCSCLVKMSYSPSSDSYWRSSGNCCSSGSSGGGTTSCCNFFGFTKKDLVKAGFYRTKCFQEVICCGCGWETKNCSITFRHLNFLHKLFNPDCEMSHHIPGNFNCYVEHKKSVCDTEDMMKETFLFWPKTYPVIEDMAKQGLYYTGRNDDVACIECNVILNNWTKDDVITDRHVRSSPNCELVKCLMK